jgi:hypothetical protein
MSADACLANVYFVYLAIAVTLASVVGYAWRVLFGEPHQPQRVVTVDLGIGDFVDGEPQASVRPEPVISIVRRQGAAKPDADFTQWQLCHELKIPAPVLAWWADQMTDVGEPVA